jgi:hypothetical protein
MGMSKQAVFWVVPETSPSNAGYRVRTLPLASALEEFSITPTIVSAKEFAASIKSIADEAALVIVAKPGDTMMFLCMQYLVGRNVRVLADIFDNYFSWAGGLYQRGLHWQWLRALDPAICSGVITSTPYLAAALRKICTSNVCLVSDLAPRESMGELGALKLNRKWHAPQQVEILWYGISGNPYFRAGLDDLISWTRVIARIRDRLRLHCGVRLTICTNHVPAVGEALKAFASEGIDTRFIPWTTEGCDELLQASHVVLLPSNLSGFSLSKTHNRCSDALWHHCLALVSPNGPYRDLDGAVYRDVNELCDDLLALDHSGIAARLRLAAAEISRTYSKSDHVERLARLIKDTTTERDVAEESARASSPRILILGSTIIPQLVEFARTLGFLTACFEGSHLKEKVDFIFKCDSSAEGKITIRMSDAGKAVALETLLSSGNRARNIDAQVEKTGEALSSSVTLPLSKSLLEAAKCAESIVDAHSEMREYMHDLHSEIIITALRGLGISNFDLCTETAGGWESYTRLAAPQLWKACRDLRQIWQQDQGREHEIARRLPSHAIERQVVNA